MSIIVYWACNEEEWLRSKEPESIYKTFSLNLKNNDSKVQMCPSVRDYMKNTFSLKSIYDYNFYVTKENAVLSNMYDQLFFEQHVNVLYLNKKIFSFS